MSQILDSLDDARAAAARQAWRAAYAAYVDVDAGALTASDLENFGEAAWWSGKIDEAIRHREKSFAAYTSDGDARSAARLALTLAWDHEGKGLVRGLARLVRQRRATPRRRRRSARARTPAPDEGTRRDDAGRARGRRRALRRGVRARKARRRPRRPDARALRQGAHVHQARARSTRASRSSTRRAPRRCAATSAPTRPASSTASRSAPARTSATTAAPRSGRRRRTAGATRSTSPASPARAGSTAPRRCACEATGPRRRRRRSTACEELKDFDQMIPAAGCYEIGEIRRRRGDLVGAEEAYRISSELGREPQPGLSLLRLAEGKIDAALAGITRSLEETQGPLFRLRRLPAQVEIAIAAGDLKTARAAADEAEQIVDAYKIGDRRAAAFDATVHFARGQILLAEKDWDGAIAALKHARDEWQGVGAPYETARARPLLGNRVPREPATSMRARSSSRARSRPSSGSAPSRRRSAIKELLGRVETRRTFLFTDIVDSTRLLETLGDDKWKRLLARHNELVRECDRRSGRRDREADRRRLLRVVREPEGRASRRRWRSSARSRPRSSRPTCASARTREARSARSRVDRLRWTGRPRRVPHRRSGGGRRDPRQLRDARRRRGRLPTLGAAHRDASRASSSPSRSSRSTGAEGQPQASGERPR